MKYKQGVRKTKIVSGTGYRVPEPLILLKKWKERGNRECVNISDSEW